MSRLALTVVVVAYGHADYVPQTLQSIARDDFPANCLEVVVVDNGDGASAGAARAALPDATVLQPGKNLGFAGGCNLAAAHSTAPLLALVNPDVELRPGFLHALARSLQDETVGIAGGKLLFPDSTTVQHAGGSIHWPLARTSHRGYGEPDSLEYDQPLDVDYVTGAALAIRRDTWQRIGGFDEAFAPAYFEEVDLCLRVQAAGLRVVYVPTAVGIHREASALGRTSAAYYRLYHANRLRLLFKHRDDRFLITEWLPAELRHLRIVADDNEVDGLCWSYHLWQRHFLTGGQETDASTEGWATNGPMVDPPVDAELAWTLRQAEAKHTVKPVPFRSRLPGVSHVRRLWNAVATEEYVRPILQQQNDFNASLVELARALERQRRSADGAILCQGMLLAKTMKSPGR